MGQRDRRKWNGTTDFLIVQFIRDQLLFFIFSPDRQRDQQLFHPTIYTGPTTFFPDFYTGSPSFFITFGNVVIQYIRVSEK